jgi:hypothetical protein
VPCFRGSFAHSVADEGLSRSSSGQMLRVARRIPSWTRRLTLECSGASCHKARLADAWRSATGVGSSSRGESVDRVVNVAEGRTRHKEASGITEDKTHPTQLKS